MKNQSILVAVVALASVTVLAGCNQPSSSAPIQPAAQRAQQPLAAALFNPVYASDSYVEYTPAALAKAKADGKDTAVFFHSKTCGSCAKLDANFEENEVIIPEELVVFKADWDANQALAGELNVAKYHTVSYYNDDGTTDNVAGLFTVEEVVKAGTEEKKVLSANGQYRMYDGADIAMAQKEGKDIALFFHSKTCGSCAKLNEDILNNDNNLPENLIVYKTDWDENQALAKTYDVAKYHTVAFIDGTESRNVKGLFTAQELADASTNSVEEVIVGNAGEYKVYSEEALVQAQAAGKDTALFFHGKTCGSCAKLDAAISTDVNDLPENLVVFKTDWDENQVLAKKYNVAKYHTVAFMNDDGTSKNVKGLFTVGDVVAAHGIQ